MASYSTQSSPSGRTMLAQQGRQVQQQPQNYSGTGAGGGSPPPAPSPTPGIAGGGQMTANRPMAQGGVHQASGMAGAGRTLPPLRGQTMGPSQASGRSMVMQPTMGQPSGGLPPLPGIAGGRPPILGQPPRIGGDGGGRIKPNNTGGMVAINPVTGEPLPPKVSQPPMTATPRPQTGQVADRQFEQSEADYRGIGNSGGGGLPPLGSGSMPMPGNRGTVAPGDAPIEASPYGNSQASGIGSPAAGTLMRGQMQMREAPKEETSPFSPAGFAAGMQMVPDRLVDKGRGLINTLGSTFQNDVNNQANATADAARNGPEGLTPPVPGGGGGGPLGDLASLPGQMLTGITNALGEPINAISDAMSENDRRRLEQYFGPEMQNYRDVMDRAKQLMDPAAQAAAEKAARDQLQASVGSERDTALRMLEAKQNRGGGGSSGGATGIYNTAMNNLAQGERGLTQDAFGRQLAGAQAGMSGAMGANNALANLLQSGFTSNKELASMLLQGLSGAGQFAGNMFDAVSSMKPI